MIMLKMTLLPTWMRLPDDYISDLELPRSSTDNVANGRVGEDKNVGACTYVGSKGSSLVDFCIVNVELLSEFSTFFVHDPNILSDHCLIEFSLASRFSYCQIEKPSEEHCEYQYFRWNDGHKAEYQNYLVSEAFKEKLARLSYMV